MASTLATFDFALKERYTAKMVADLTFQNRPLLAKLPKDTNFEGDVEPIPVAYSDPQGVSATLANAQTGESNLTGQKFNITVGEIDGVVSIGDKVMKASRGNAGAFLKNHIGEIDGIINQVANSMTVYLYGNGGNALGQRASETSEVITLTNIGDTVNFEVGMTIEGSLTDGLTGAVRAGSTFVTAVNYEANTITVDDASDITGFADDDFIFRLGTHGQTTGVDIVQGLSAWIPATAPSATAFFGVDRTANITRLSGTRLLTTDVAGLDQEERHKRLCTRISSRGGGPGATDIFLNPEKWQDLEIGLASRGLRSVETKIGSFGYQTLELVAGGQKVAIWSDRFCPLSTGFALHMPSWKLKSMLGVPHFLNGDGLRMLRKGASNDYEVRVVAYPQLCTNRPGWSGRTPV